RPVALQKQTILAKERIHGCSENAHIHDPGSRDSARSCSLAPAAMGGCSNTSESIDLADWFAPSAARSRALFLVCGSVHLHRQRNASAHGCSEIPGQRGTVSLDAQ